MSIRRDWLLLDSITAFVPATVSRWRRRWLLFGGSPSPAGSSTLAMAATAAASMVAAVSGSASLVMAGSASAAMEVAATGEAPLVMEAGPVTPSLAPGGEASMVMEATASAMATMNAAGVAGLSMTASGSLIPSVGISGSATIEMSVTGAGLGEYGVGGSATMVFSSSATAWPGTCFIVFRDGERDEPQEPVAWVGGDVLSVDLTGLLPVGESTLAVRRANRFGTQSVSTRLVVVSALGQEPVTQFVEASQVTARAASGGMVVVGWYAVSGGTIPAGQTTPAKWEVAEASDPGTILLEVSGGPRSFLESVGPLGTGRTVRMMVRASDGVLEGSGGRRGPWVTAEAVVVDGVGPDVPELVEAQG